MDPSKPSPWSTPRKSEFGEGFINESDAILKIKADVEAGGAAFELLSLSEREMGDGEPSQEDPSEQRQRQSAGEQRQTMLVKTRRRGSPEKVKKVRSPSKSRRFLSPQETSPKKRTKPQKKNEVETLNLDIPVNARKGKIVVKNRWKRMARSTLQLDKEKEEVVEVRKSVSTSDLPSPTKEQRVHEFSSPTKMAKKRSNVTGRSSLQASPTKRSPTKKVASKAKTGGYEQQQQQQQQRQQRYEEEELPPRELVPAANSPIAAGGTSSSSGSDGSPLKRRGGTARARATDVIRFPKPYR